MKAKRSAGMASFLARLANAHQQLANDPKLTAKQRAFQQSQADAIKATLAKRGRK